MIRRGSEALVPSLGMGVERQEGAGAGEAWAGKGRQSRRGKTTHPSSSVPGTG